MKVNFVLFQDPKALKWGEFEYKSAELIYWCGQCCAFSFTHISHFNIPRPAVTFKQLQNCVFLFTIYAPQSPTLLPKLRLTWVHIHEFSQPEGMPSGTEALSFIWEGQHQQQEEEQCTVIVNMVKDTSSLAKDVMTPLQTQTTTVLNNLNQPDKINLKEQNSETFITECSKYKLWHIENSSHCHWIITCYLIIFCYHSGKSLQTLE